MYGIVSIVRLTHRYSSGTAGLPEVIETTYQNQESVHLSIHRKLSPVGTML